MERFSAAVRTLVEPSSLDGLEAAILRAEELKRDRISPSDFSPVAKIPLKVRVLNQAALRRILDLADALVRDTNAGQLAPVFVSARAALETALSAADVGLATHQLLTAKNKAGLPALDERIMKGLVGAKSRDWGAAEVQAVNILTVVDRFAKLVSPALSVIYGDLSEHAHPNWLGTAGAYSDIDEVNGDMVFIERPLLARPTKIALPLSATQAALDLMISTIDGYEEEMAAFVSLCEEAMHDEGTWPTNAPYPRPDPHR